MRQGVHVFHMVCQQLTAVLLTLLIRGVPGVTVKNIPTREMIPLVYFCI